MNRPGFRNRKPGRFFALTEGQMKTQYEYIQYKNEYMLKFLENTCIFIKMGVL